MVQANHNKLIQLAHSISPFIIGGEGNVSCLGVAANTFIVKASGTSLKTLDVGDLVKCSLDGTQLDNFDKKSSIETGFHSWLLQLPDVKYVAHTHPTHTLKLLCSNEIYNFAERRLFPDQVVFNGSSSCVVEYAHPGEELLENIKTAVTEYMENCDSIPKLILLKNHGVICIGKTCESCVIATEMCEKSAEIYLGGSLTNQLTFLSADGILKIETDESEKYRQSLLK